MCLWELMFAGCDWNYDGGPDNRRFKMSWSWGRLRHYNLWMLSNGDYSTNMVVGYEMKIINDPPENFWSKRLWSKLATRAQIPDDPSPEEWQPKQPRTVCGSLLENELNAISAEDQTTGSREQS